MLTASTSELLRPSTPDNGTRSRSTSVGHLSSDSTRAPTISQAFGGLHIEDINCYTPLFWAFFIGLVVHTLVTMMLVAYYLAWHIGPETMVGIKTAIVMAGILLLAAVGPFWEEVARHRAHS